MSTKLFKALMAVALIVAVGLAFASPVSAGTVLTTNTNLNANGTQAGVGPTGPPLPGVTTVDVSPLRFYTNTFSGTPNGPVGSTTDIRTVIVGQLSSAHDGVSYSPIFGPGASKDSIAVLGAVEGTATVVSPGVFRLDITAGGFGLYAAPTGIDTTKPSTFPTVSSPFAQFTLGPKDSVIPGSPNPDLAAQVFQSASVMNQSTVNNADNSQNQGRVLFANSTGASSFLQPGVGTPPPQPPIGVFVHFAQLLENVTATTSGLNNTTDLATLNAIQTKYVGDIWATGIGNQGHGTSDWNPNPVIVNGNVVSSSGDFRALGEGAEFHPYAAAPEPASLTLMGVGLGGLAFAIRRRKNSVQA